MRILVTGAAGMLGHDLVDACRRRGHDVVGLGHAALDITDDAAVAEALGRIRPDAVANCAAYTDVDGAEADEAAAMRVNDTGAGVLAAAAAGVGAKVLYPSSDYVFDGHKRRPYVESDLTGAISAYGRSKLAGETAVAAANRRHFIVRASWLFGVAGGNFVETMLRVGREQPEVVVVSDQVGCPTYTGHLAAALADLIESEEFGIHHIAAGGACSWFDFAQEIFDQAGVDCRVLGGTTEMLGRPAPRPYYSALGSERRGARLLPDWQAGLAAYLAEREGAGRGHIGDADGGAGLAEEAAGR
jgi:dTDP-4-dehydrorhamnose reductase